jgi:D-arginine dehydrogenase
VSLDVDVLIVGAGMAGASLAAEIAGQRSVLLTEAEPQPGYHATGRSAAFWTESYGGPVVQPLTTASGPFLERPPAHFGERSFLKPRGALYLADGPGRDALDALFRRFRDSGVRMEPLGRADLERMIPGLKPGWDNALWEPSCADIDVAALHAAYLKKARAGGARLLTGTPFLSARRTRTGWVVQTGAGEIEAAIIVNAAGAWADDVAERAGEVPLGIRPYRRTVAQLRTNPPASVSLPLVLDARERFYFKPETGRLWLSPHDETPSLACDTAAEEQDVARAIFELEQVVDWRVERIEHSWAGLRSFAPDRLPVYGYADGRSDFFWCAGQGGFGIQTAPAAAKLAASLLLAIPPDTMVAGIDAAPYLAERFTN